MSPVSYQPALIDGVGCQRRVGVAREELGTSGTDLPRVTDGSRRPVGANNSISDAGDEPPVRMDPLLERI